MHDLGGSPGSHLARPGHAPYPAGALGWLLPVGSPRVLDLGAGTGRLTRQLRARRLDVVAVDPSPAMLAELRRTRPEVPAHQGDAHRIPLPDASADVVIVAEAWCWEEPDRAVTEIARVLSPGGRLGLIRNVRDDSTDWVARLGDIIGGSGPAGGPRLGPVERAAFRWAQTLTPAELIGLAGSRSGMILLPADERAAVLAQVRQLMATHPALLGRETYELPYVTECVRTTLTPRRP
ncbi:class I SAM-dependent methyltransferase [Actinoplanes sp. NPDC023801]|uniref:class I SAM-dependent methyltransferase n=1 Tax=Actinoplanes sp. NPDC023801 TaxID=3154595 RepID=UPI0033FC1B3E